jgi:hypothetical protein
MLKIMPPVTPAAVNKSFKKLQLGLGSGPADPDRDRHQNGKWIVGSGSEMVSNDPQHWINDAW